MRDLKPGDRVKITGPWNTHCLKETAYLGKAASVEGFTADGTPRILIDGWTYCVLWCRELGIQPEEIGNE